MIPRAVGRKRVAFVAFRVWVYGGASRGVGHTRQGVALAAFVERLHDCVAQVVVSDGAHGSAVNAKLRGVVGKVGRCSPELLLAGEDVPKYFAYANYQFVHVFFLFRRRGRSGSRRSFQTGAKLLFPVQTAKFSQFAVARRPLSVEGGPLVRQNVPLRGCVKNVCRSFSLWLFSANFAPFFFFRALGPFMVLLVI